MSVCAQNDGTVPRYCKFQIGMIFPRILINGKHIIGYILNSAYYWINLDSLTWTLRLTHFLWEVQYLPMFKTQYRNEIFNKATIRCLEQYNNIWSNRYILGSWPVADKRKPASGSGSVSMRISLVEEVFQAYIWKMGSLVPISCCANVNPFYINCITFILTAK